MKKRTKIICLTIAVLFAAIWGLSEVPLFETGLEAYEQQDYATALNEWKPLAENKGFLATPDGPLCMIGVCYEEEDVTKAQYNLGAMYASGHGVPQDNIRALMWINIAASKGLETALKYKDVVAKKMTSAQIAEAQKLVQEYTKGVE